MIGRQGDAPQGQSIASSMITRGDSKGRRLDPKTLRGTCVFRITIHAYFVLRVALPRYADDGPQEPWTLVVPVQMSQRFPVLATLGMMGMIPRVVMEGYQSWQVESHWSVRRGDLRRLEDILLHACGSTRSMLLYREGDARVTIGVAPRRRRRPRGNLKEVRQEAAAGDRTMRNTITGVDIHAWVPVEQGNVADVAELLWAYERTEQWRPASTRDHPWARDTRPFIVSRDPGHSTMRLHTSEANVPGHHGFPCRCPCISYGVVVEKYPASALARVATASGNVTWEVMGICQPAIGNPAFWLASEPQCTLGHGVRGYFTNPSFPQNQIIFGPIETRPPTVPDPALGGGPLEGHVT
ncbi:hypothetical protein EDB84DRAFT_1437695 [Lactarius hengduanensis]|nr:hypothetical protein EDB84DRAFT_1437695 [Lactarius hengduanensis]